MSRLEENKKVIEEMIKRAADKSPATYQEMMTFQTDAIVNMLADISKSLAILADRAEKEQTLDNIEEVYLNLMRIQAEKEPGPKWIPVKDPLNELPKDRTVLVTVKTPDSYYYVEELYYDMTEWSDINVAEQAIAYLDNFKYPEPYKEE